MGLIEVQYLEKALGVPVGSLNQDQAQYYIDTVSSYVESYTGVTFTPQVDVTLRLQADYYGQITLHMKPIQDVTEVLPADQTTPCDILLTTPSWGFDGYDTIYNLQPHSVYLVTLSYGYDEVPQDIKSYVTEQCINKVNNPNNLEAFRVGDVTETYGTKTQVNETVSVAGLGQEVLDSYKDTEETWRLGPRAYPTQSWNWF